MTTIINGSSPSITFSDGSAQTSATRPFLNRIINGAMVIDQRNAGASVNATNSAVFPVDRFYTLQAIVSTKFTAQQSSTAPTGFVNSVVCTSNSAYTVGSTEYFLYRQAIEGYNVADLQWGTANAKTVTLSFWVRSSLTGTFGGALGNSSSDRSYPFSYTISTANTWQQVSVTITGDTTGTWLTTNGAGIVVSWSLGMGATYSGTAGAWATGFYGSATGATSVVGTNGATWYITGVQLEVGSTATSFDYRPYGTELALCQRYYWRSSGTSGSVYPAVGAGGFLTTTSFSSFIPYPVQMRATPTFSIGTSLFITTSGFPNITAIDANYSSQNSGRVQFTTSSSTAGFGGAVGLNNATTSFIDASAEL